METILWVLFFARLLIPLSILKYPLWGGLASFILDATDAWIAHLFGVDYIFTYHFVDKLMDMWYLTIMLIASWKWEKIARNTSIVLYGWRLIGFFAFEYTGFRWLLMVFPNVFELWFFFMVVRNKFFKWFEITKKRLIVILVALLIPKLFHEYILHVVRFCDKSYFNYCGLEKIFRV
ncbi:MAG: hypothetical protein ABIA93_02045 [Candidatus Woesearchaeota archaeon]